MQLRLPAHLSSLLLVQLVSMSADKDAELGRALATIDRLDTELQVRGVGRRCVLCRLSKRDSIDVYCT